MVTEWVKDLLDPCFDCQPQGRAQRTTSAVRTERRAPGLEVELVVSALARLRGFAGYHTSVLVAGEEYYFSPSGICCSPKVCSHDEDATKHIEFVGLSQQSGTDLLDFLTDYFRPCTYDLLRKNCNSFTDCALYFLCQQRLDPRYRQIEQFGRTVDEHARIIQVVSRGEYVPNPRAFNFNLEVVILDIMRARDGADVESDVDEKDTPRRFQSQAISRPREFGVQVPFRAVTQAHDSDRSSYGGVETHPWLSDNRCVHERQTTIRQPPNTSRGAGVFKESNAYPRTYSHLGSSPAEYRGGSRRLSAPAVFRGAGFGAGGC